MILEPRQQPPTLRCVEYRGKSPSAIEMERRRSQLLRPWHTVARLRGNFPGEHFHNAGPRLKFIEQHSVHLMALTIAVQAVGGAQLMRLEIEITSRHRQCRQESP